jgi:AAA+ superfamily predicted ATPase
MYTEISKIIEAGLQKDNKKVIIYSKLLADKFESDGETKLATKIRLILKNDSIERSAIKEQFLNLPVDNETRLSIADIITSEKNKTRLILSDSVKEASYDFIQIVKFKEKLQDAGVEMNSSLLLYGPPGCGKTSLAMHIAKEIDLPIILARLDSMISSLLGNTSKNLRKLFEFANEKPCILFLDEFDAIAKNRKDQNEQGELKRVINSLLQNIDDFLANGNILIAATNHEELLDDAIWRRFEKIISLDKPSDIEIKALVNDLLIKTKNEISETEIDKTTAMFRNLSYSEIKKIINSSITKSIIKGKNGIEYIDLVISLFQYKHANDFTEDALIKFLNDNTISQKDISSYLNISIRQVRNNLSLIK